MNIDGKEINCIAFAPCPIERPLQSQLHRILDEHKLKTGEKLKAVLPSFVEDKAKYDNFAPITGLEMLPDVIVSMGFGDFMESGFIKAFVNKENFAECGNTEMNENFHDGGYIDKGGCYTLISSFPVVFLVDLNELGDLPVPAGWSDLLDERYFQKIAVSGRNEAANDAVLLTIYKYFGESGIKKLAHNVLATGGYSKIVNDMLRQDHKPAVYAIPYYFALKGVMDGGMKLVWPKDGAILDPVYMLTKKTGFNKTRAITSFMTGRDFGKLAAESGFPVPHADIDNRLPAGARFKWVGWDFIRNNDIHRLKKDLAEIFRNVRLHSKTTFFMPIADK